MNNVYALENIPGSGTSIMLCGPSPRPSQAYFDNELGWRPEALACLKTMKNAPGGGWYQPDEEHLFPDHVFIPEPKKWNHPDLLRHDLFQHNLDYEGQIDWEREALEKASVILFWIPRDLSKFPGFTTNIEFGWWMNSGKVVLGFPADAPKTKYIERHAKRLGIPTSYSLADTLRDALKMLHKINQTKTS